MLFIDQTAEKMAKKLRKSLRIYFSKLKKIRTMSLPNTTTTSSLLSACKYPKTPSFAEAERRQPDADYAATLSDVDRFLFENFHSLYIRNDEDTADSSPNPIKPSDRFFVSPQVANTLAVDEARTSSTMTTSSSSSPNPGVAIPEESVAITTLSKDPYRDFRRSMQEMVDVRHVDPQQPLDWDFMEELLFCFLELNDHSVHKHILRAFSDLTVSFRRGIPQGRRKVPAATVTATARRRKVVEKCHYPAGGGGRT